jgi:hypothetical protein
LEEDCDDGLLAMSARERERLVVIRGVGKGRVKQSVAAQRPGMSVRKFKRNPTGSMDLYVPTKQAPNKMVACGRC